jgi:carbon monoxide dehydrogenase subunit G
MKVALDKVFPLAATAESAWLLLQDIETVAGCMPGAKITERIDETHYKGTITVRLGPATMAFKGEIEVLNLDTATRSLHMVGKGSDATGTSDLTAAVQATGDTCELAGKSEVTMSGKAASLGGRLMGPVADQMLKQFVANFAARLQAQQMEAAGEGADAAGAINTPTVGATASASSASDASACSAASADPATAMPAAASAGMHTTTTTATAATTATGAAKAAAAPSARPATMPEPTAPPAELNGLAMAWAILRDWLRGLFSHKTV